MLLTQGRASGTTWEEKHFCFVVISLKSTFCPRLLNCWKSSSSTFLRQRPHSCRLLCSPRTSPCLRFREHTVNYTFYWVLVSHFFLSVVHHCNVSLSTSWTYPQRQMIPIRADWPRWINVLISEEENTFFELFKSAETWTLWWKVCCTKEVLSWRFTSPYAEFWFYFTTGEKTSEAVNV